MSSDSVWTTEETSMLYHQGSCNVPVGLVTTSLHAVMRDVGAVKKEGRNEFQKYMFRGIAQVMDAVTPLLIQHNLILTVDYSNLKVIAQDKGWSATVSLTLGFEHITDGSRREYRSVGMGSDSGDKAANKAMTAAYKYALCHGLGIRENEVGTDGDADSPVVSHPTVTKTASAPRKLNF